MNEAMLRQLFWISIVGSLKFTAADYFIQPAFDQCDRPQCATIDEILEKNVVSNAEPCDDFFHYACGARDKPHTLDLAYSFDLPPTFKEENMQNLADFLSNRNLDTERNDALKIERQIYAECERSGQGPYTNEAKKRYWNLIQEKKRHITDSWSPIDLKIAQEGFGFAFFDVDIVERVDPRKPEPRRYIQISPPTDNILDINYLLRPHYEDKLRDDLDDKEPKEAAARRAHLMNFVDDFNKIVPYGKFDDLDSADNILPAPQKLSEWSRKYEEKALHSNSKIRWDHLLNSLFNTASVQIGQDEDIIVIDEQYFFHLIELLHSVNDARTIGDYIVLRYVSKTIGFVLSEYKDKYAVIPPIKGLVCTPGLLVGAAREYARNFFPKGNNEVLHTIFDNVKGAIESQLVDHYYNPTAYNVTRNFVKQLHNADVLVGFPDFVLKKDAEQFYSMSVGELYYRNQINAMAYLLRHKLNTYKNRDKPLIDIKLFFKTLTDDSISFSKNLKQIVLPVRAFSENDFKFVSNQLYDPINYGAAGTAIASELYLVWLRRIAYDQTASKCVREQMPRNRDTAAANEYLLRATAWLLGVRTAHAAWPSKDSYPIQFPMYGAVSDFRLFFISYAESLCAARNRTTDIPPEKFINFALSNSVEFAKAFRCFKHHRINRPKKCDPLKNSSRDL